MEDIQTIIEKVKMDLQDGKSDEEIFQTTLHLFGRDPEIDRQMVELMAAIPQVKIANLLHRMLQVSKEKKVRKDHQTISLSAEEQGDCRGGGSPRKEELHSPSITNGITERVWRWFRFSWSTLPFAGYASHGSRVDSDAWGDQ